MDSEEVSDQESILSEEDNRAISGGAAELDQEMASAGEEESKAPAGLGDA